MHVDTSWLTLFPAMWNVSYILEELIPFKRKKNKHFFCEIWVAYLSLTVMLGHKVGGLLLVWNRLIFLWCHVILAILFLLPLPHSFMCGSCWYFCSLFSCASQQLNSACSKVTSVKVCFDYFLLLTFSFITNLGTESEYLKDVYTRDYSMLKDVCFRTAQQHQNFYFFLTTVKTHNLHLTSFKYFSF